MKTDRLSFLSGFFAKFYNVDAPAGRPISDEAIRPSWNIASGASPLGTSACVSAWLTDFRTDLATIDIPTLVIHGDSDRILPISATGEPTHALVKGSRFVVIEGGPHGLTWTHAGQVNSALLDFLGQGRPSSLTSGFDQDLQRAGTDTSSRGTPTVPVRGA